MRDHMSDRAIEVEGLVKSFRIADPDGGRRVLSGRKTAEHRVIDGMDLSVGKGEILGIIGGNGAGKSTFLKLLTGILEPDEGSIRMDGKVASILELGMGFHQDLSGRENIALKCGYYGMGRNETAEAVDRIIEYSELGTFIDSPVKTYSSGMNARLAFSVMMCVDAEIMIVDEIMSVGDLTFSMKSKGHFRRMKDAGKTVVLTSHNMRTIETLCDRVVWLESGKVRMDGDPATVCSSYRFFMSESDDVIEKMAHAGVADAEYRHGHTLLYRDGDETSYREYLERASKGGCAPAMREYGDIRLSEGDVEEAVRHYASAASLRDADAARRHAVLEGGMIENIRRLDGLYDGLDGRYGPFLKYNHALLLLRAGTGGMDVAKALQLLEDAYAHGSLDAGHQLAQMHLRGTGVPRSMDRAVSIMEDVARKGHTRSQTQLAQMFMDGDAVRRDTAHSFEFYLMAAENGDRNAQCKVADMYREGIGTDKDMDSAREWYRIYACSCIVDQIISAAKAVEAPGSGFDMTADELYDMAAITSNRRATRQIRQARAGPVRTSLMKDESLRKDPEKAFRLFSELAASGDAEATLALAMMYKDGIYVEPDTEMYRSNVRTAAMLGNKDAKAMVERWERRKDRRKAAKANRSANGNDGNRSIRRPCWSPNRRL